MINSESSGEVSRLSAGESIFRGKSARSGGLDSFPRNLGAGGAHADGAARQRVADVTPITRMQTTRGMTRTPTSAV